VNGLDNEVLAPLPKITRVKSAYRRFRLKKSARLAEACLVRVQEVERRSETRAMHVFTSIAINYLPKARFLAASVKRLHPRCRFHLLCVDSLQGVPKAELSDFDDVIAPEKLSVPKWRSWAFKHDLMELCTALKGLAARYIWEHHGEDTLFYLDPDIAVFGSLSELEQELSQNSVLLTPCQLIPEHDAAGVAENEIGSLIHGAFCLGFLAVAPSREGRRFVEWWSARLQHHCYNDPGRGLFTDQRWVDLAPAFFPTLGIVRHPEYNVARWNLSQRDVGGKAPHELTIDGRKLCFFHFSGIDSGLLHAAVRRYAPGNSELQSLVRWYEHECERAGQKEYGRRQSGYALFDNGQPITRGHRALYRTRLDLQTRFPDPFSTVCRRRSYAHWYRLHVTWPERLLGGVASVVRQGRRALQGDMGESFRAAG
jgi:hypothetical protein